MFVRKSKFDAMKAQRDEYQYSALSYQSLADTYRERYYKLVSKWNDLVDRVNDAGGVEAIKSANTQFTDEEIKKLRILCHPDRHDGKKMAVDITQKLNKMVKK